MTFLSPLVGIFAEDPAVRTVQFTLLALATVDVFLVFYATRDILLRTRLFLYQFLCIVLVAVLPGLGFLIYLLVRPARTVRQRETDALVERIAGVLGEWEGGEIEELEDLSEGDMELALMPEEGGGGGQEGPSANA